MSDGWITVTKWSREDDEILTREWNEGTGTEQIAPLLSVKRTKNSLIGRAHRLGLAMHKNARGRGQRPTKEQKAFNLFTPVNGARLQAAKIAIDQGDTVKREEFAVEDPGQGFVTWPEVREAGRQILEDWLATRDNDNGCRWPIGDKPLEKDFYCGMPKDDNCSYCKPHRKRAYRPAQQGNSGHAFVLRYIRG